MITSSVSAEETDLLWHVFYIRYGNADVAGYFIYVYEVY